MSTRGISGHDDLFRWQMPLLTVASQESNGGFNVMNLRRKFCLR
jgi:hypothetical protein